MKQPTCNTCGTRYENTSSGRHNHRVINGHTPVPEKPEAVTR